MSLIEHQINEVQNLQKLEICLSAYSYYSSNNLPSSGPFFYKGTYPFLLNLSFKPLLELDGFSIIILIISPLKFEPLIMVISC